jgi:SAM-dependent methyltransferase
MTTVNEANFWESRYLEGRDPWDLGQPAPALVQLLASSEAPPPSKVVVLGCGRGYDALLFAEQGHQVTGFDFAAPAITQAQQLANQRQLSVTYRQLDLFALPDEYQGAFNLVIEHTCFCAIAVERRADYVQVVHRLLRPEGELLAVFFVHPRPGGPPYATSAAEITQLFGNYFEIDRLGVAPSVAARQGEELFGRLRRKAYSPKVSPTT